MLTIGTSGSGSSRRNLTKKAAREAIEGHDDAVPERVLILPIIVRLDNLPHVPIASDEIDRQAFDPGRRQALIQRVITDANLSRVITPFDTTAQALAKGFLDQGQLRRVFHQRAQSTIGPDLP